MFKALELENFKAFGKRTRFEFAPITLIYGPNSAGKSSILNALNLLKQTRSAREHGALLLPRAEGGLVDLGSFHEILFDHDASRTLSFRLEFAPTRQHIRPLNRPTRNVSALELAFRREQDEKDISLARLDAYTTHTAEPAVRFEPTADQSGVRFPSPSYRRLSAHRNHGNSTTARCLWVTGEPRFWEQEYAECQRHKGEILGLLERIAKGIATEEAISVRLGEISAHALRTAIDFFRSEFSLNSYIERRRAAASGSLLALDGFMPVGIVPRETASFPELVAAQSGPAVRRASAIRNLFFDAADLLLEGGLLLENALDSLFPLGPYRRPPERLYVFTGTTPPDVGYSGNLLPDLLYRQGELVEETNSWLEKLDIGYQLRIEPLGTRSNDLFEVRLRDTRRGSAGTVSLPDVGFGISQLLPFVVQALASRGRTITIEQPEVHVHPRLQADVADLLVAGIQPQRGNHFIVETHSEHLILRILRRIRETTSGDLPVGTPGLQPEQVSVLFLERGANGTEVHRLRINEDGEFIDRWPQGFFEERARELF